MKSSGAVNRIIPDMPCGCVGSSAYNQNRNVVLMHDGSRICLVHKRRFILTYKEIPY